METAIILIIWTKEVDTELTGMDKMEKMIAVIAISNWRINREIEPTEKLKGNFKT